MIFNTFAYFFLFLLPAAVLFRVAAPEYRARVLIASGALFFIYFSVTELGGWVGALCLTVFFWEAVFSRLYRPGSAWCLAGILQALLVLFVFKYWNFVVSTVGGSSSSLIWAGAFLPLGVSFFTFEFIHYARDRQQGTAEKGRLDEYLAFILFFPTMVAGPIKRYQDFVPALRDPSDNWPLDFERGITRILTGLAKKFVVADFMSSFTQNLNATDIAQAERWVLPIWLVAYGIKIYFDFSAYSDIAIGSARLFGLRVKENFDWPYARTSISDFWRHWHMSLSKWLMDYVYIPLGGSRGRSHFAVYFNLFVTMLVSGVWHGAGLNFVIWGAWHGAALAVNRWWSRRTSNSGRPASALANFAAWALTMIVVILGWAWFCMDVPTALFFFRRMIAG